MSGEESTQKALTPRQRKFVNAYMGEAASNAGLAAKLAGYTGTDSVLAATASRLLKKSNIQAELHRISEKSPYVASREDRLRFLSEVMADPSHPMTHRLRATELLAKASGDYIQRVELSGGKEPVHGSVDISGLSPDILDKLIKVTKGD